MGARVSILALLFGIIAPVSALGQASGETNITEGMPSEVFAVPGCRQLQVENAKVDAYVALHPESVVRSSLLKPSWSFAVGSTHTWKAYDYDKSTYYDVASTCHAIGTHCYIFVQDSLWGTRVTQAAADSVMYAFDDHTPANPSKGVYQMDVETFGTPPDIDGDPRIIILILNIQDGFSGSGGYVAGYFWGGNEVQNYPNGNNAEIYYVDANPLDLTKPWGITAAMSTAAHEFQHMIHFSKDNQEITFVNEGCSCYAESYCGFGIEPQSGYVHETNHYLLDWRQVNDQNVLNDYSRAARFFQYFGDQFGSGVFAPIVASKLHGIAGLDAGLAASGTDRRFAQIFQDWLVANTLDDRTVNLRFGYVYPRLLKAVGVSYANPTVSLTQATVADLGAAYLSYAGGSDLRITFITSSSSIVIEAVEIGSPSRVVSVTPGIEFHEAGFGTTYSAVNFVVMNTSQTASVSFSYQSTGGIVADVSTPGAQLPTAMSLGQNYPNPFNPSTTIKYTVGGNGAWGVGDGEKAGTRGSGPALSGVEGLGTRKTMLVVYDVLGRQVATLVDEAKAPGSYEVQFDASALPSGVYYYRLTAGSFSQAKAMVLVK